MMSAHPDFGLAPKRPRVVATYGKSRYKTSTSSATESIEPYLKAPTNAPTAATAPPILSRPRTDDASARRPVISQPTVQTVKSKKLDIEQEREKKGSVLGALPKIAKTAPDATRPAKRKPIQQPSTTRVMKKQRSSSPDVFAFPPSTPPRASSSSPPPPATKQTRPLERWKAPPAPVPKPISKTVGLNGVRNPSRETEMAPKQQSVLVRPPQKLSARPRPKPPPPAAEERAMAAVSAKVAVAVKPRPEPSRSSSSSVARKPAPTSTPVRKRPRLIDALNAQAEPSPPSSPLSPPLVGGRETGLLSEAMSSQVSEDASTMETSSPAPAPTPPQPQRARTFARQTSMNRKPGLKFTYSQQRSMLADESVLAGVDPDKADAIAFSQPLLPPSLSNVSDTLDFDDGLMEDPSVSGAVRSIHELRQAGANSRVADGMNDILDRIGVPSAKPSSMRRNALLETAQKMQDKAFRLQFSNHRNGTSSLLKGLGNETDPIAGIMIATILVTLLGTTNSSHLTRQLPLADIARLAALLLPISTDVNALAKDRKSNMSRFAQIGMGGVKSSILKLDVWDSSAAPPRLSPRTLALKCMQLIAEDIRMVGAVAELDIFLPDDVTDVLFSVLKSAAEDRDSPCWDFPAQPESTDLLLALSLLEAHSIRVMQSAAGAARWNTQHLPTVADLLETSLKHGAKELGELETLVLKLTLNTANNNPQAPNTYLRKGLVRGLAKASSDTFNSVMQSIKDDSFLPAVLNSLVLMLGVMINFSEHGQSAAKTLNDFQPLDQLMRFFLDYRSRTAEADSVEKSHLNVAFGYLSVLLGYLCLYEPTRRQFASLHGGGNMEPLLNSIREFMVVLKAAGSADGSDGEAHRLQSLVDALEHGL